MRTIHAGVLFIYCQTLLWNLAAPQICLAQGSPGTQVQGSSDLGEAPFPRASPVLIRRSAALPFASAPAPAPGPSARAHRPELTATSVRSTDPATGQPVSLDSSTPRAMPAAPQQAGPNAPTPGPESGTGASGQSGLLALNGTGAGGGVNAGGGSLTGQGASTGVGDGTTAGSGGFSDAAAFGNVGGLVFDGAGNIVGGQSTFGDVQTTYSGPQEWPELVGTNALVAKAKLKSETGLTVVLVPTGSVVTTDYRADRIRIYFDPATYLVVQPRPSVG